MSRKRGRKTKNKKLKIVLWTVSILLLVGGAGLFTANYAIDKVLGSLAVDQSTSAGIADSSKADEPQDSQSSPTDEANTLQAENKSDSGDHLLEKAQVRSMAGIVDEQNSEVTSGTENSADGVVPSEAEVDLNSYSASISPEKAEAIEEDVTIKEKAKVASVLLGSLSASDISTLQSLASGGLTIEEKKKARAIMLEKLTAEQYDELIVIAAKYGVSQGKKYEEVKKD